MASELTLPYPPMVIRDLGGEGGSHGACQRAVVELKRHFRAGGLATAVRRQDEMIATGPEDLGSGQ